MKNIPSVGLSVFPTGERNTVDSFMALTEFFEQSFPEIRPDVWDDVEPMKKPFVVSDIRKAHSTPYMNPLCHYNFMWRRKAKPKAWGSFHQMAWNPKPSRHAEQFIQADVGTELEPRFTEYLKAASVAFEAHYSYFDYTPPEHKEFAQLRGHLTSRRLQECLPDMLWAQVFGAPYVRLFGLDKLLSAPAYKVEQLGDEMVYIQLTETLFDNHLRYEHVDAVRQQVKAHLDDNIFFKLQNSADHVYKTPEFNLPPKPQV